MSLRLLAALGVATVLAAPASSAPSPPEFRDSFAIRDGARLEVAGRVFRFGGANIEWLGLEGYGPADPSGPRYPNHYEIDDALAKEDSTAGDAVDERENAAVPSAQGQLVARCGEA